MESGKFFSLLSRRIAFRSESRNESGAREAQRYLLDELQPSLKEMGFECRLLDNPEAPQLPILLGTRIENRALPTILIYGHGDTVPGMDEKWPESRQPYTLTKEGNRWYGRGTADNKGQHTINLTALEMVLKHRGSLGFNTKILIETGEELGSPGLRQVCDTHRDLLRADLLIASDGPRFSGERPTIFGGSRGVANFDLRVKLRNGGQHSGNWGGLLANPGFILAHALASLVDRNGKILVPEIRPGTVPESVKEAVSKLELSSPDGPEIDPDWGEPGLTPAEKLLTWSTLDVLAFECGTPKMPTHTIPDEACARIHIRFTVDCNPAKFEEGLRRHLDRNGFKEVMIEHDRGGKFPATRLDPENPWARFVLESLTRASGKKVDVLPNLGGSIPNDAFAEILGMPTVWVPHSHPGCSHHAPNEHLLESNIEEGLKLMIHLFWDLGNKKG